MRRYVDYRVVLLAVFLGLLAGVGLSMGVAVGLLTFAGALTIGTAATALTERPAARALPRGATGTRQAQLLSAIEQAVARVDQLCSSSLVPAVESKAEEAASLGHSALGTARTVAGAVDQIDDAARQLATVGRRPDDPAVSRLLSRREALIQRLSKTADQLLDVYANLVETNATLATSTLGEGDLAAGDEQALATVSTSLDDLRSIAADLEQTGRQQLPPGS